MQKILLIGAHGLGDCLLAVQCAKHLKQKGFLPTIAFSTRDEIYKPLHHLFYTQFNIKQISEAFSEDNLLLKDKALWDSITSGFDEAYYILPDLLFNNEHAFPCEKFGTNMQHLKSIKLLESQYSPTKSIYLGLMTTTPGYLYDSPVHLAQILAKILPDYQIILPMISQWASKTIPIFTIPDKAPDNLVFDVKPDFIASIEKLKQAAYFIGTDNGPSHLAYHLTIPRLILDPQYNRAPWIARWKENYLESVPITSSVFDVADLVRTNLQIPQTTLLPRMFCLTNPFAKWKDTLLLKTQ
jgi:hypothetical protein